MERVSETANPIRAEVEQVAGEGAATELADTRVPMNVGKVGISGRSEEADSVL